MRALGDHGVLAELFEDPANGDRTVSAARLCLAKESLGERSTAAEDALGLQGLGFYPIYRWGSTAQVETWYQPVVSGEAVSAFAMTEPDAGSDVAALQLRAERRDGGWSLSGSKIWISNAPDADVYTVFARTGEHTRNGITAFVVPGDAQGLSGEALELIVSHPVGTLEFDDVRVPDDAVIGEVGAGWSVGLGTLDLFRMSVGAFGLGVGQAALLATLRHVAEREQFGRPLAGQQVIGHRLADLATRLVAARLLVYHAALSYDSGLPTTELAAMAKSLATETAQEVVDACLQLHGARGLEEGHLLAHLYREVRAPRIYEGTTEILRHVVARGLLGRSGQ